MSKQLFSIDQAVLGSLSSQQAIEAFRDLLWARAYAKCASTSLVEVTSNVFVPDDGVDVAISDTADPRIDGDELLKHGTKFQVKTGDFVPWQESQLRKEFFKDREQKATGLARGVARVLQKGDRYVLVCFGIDPPAERIKDAGGAIRSIFASCGFPDANVEVWTQTTLIGLFSAYPSLCMRINGHDQDGFRFFESWSGDADMQYTAHYDAERQQLIEELHNALVSGTIRHLRLIGEPGIGKTRLALEIARHPTLAHVAVYLRDGKTLLHSSFINELIQSDDHRVVLFIVDDCIDKDRAEIWNVVKSKGARIRLITIDHGPDSSVDEKMRTVELTSAGLDQIVSILMSHNVEHDEAERLASFCEGCPRVAHVVGDNYSHNRPNLLQSPAIVDIWERFIVGNDDPNSREVEYRRIVLTHVSLFEMFGAEKPVHTEAEFIASLVSKVDPQSTLARFYGTVKALRERRILQGGRTIYLTPRLLQIYLFRRFWELYGTSVSIPELLAEMPRDLWKWFVHTLRYAHDSTAAERAIEGFLESEEQFPFGDFPDFGGNGQIINELSEAVPHATLRCLQRTIGRMDTAQLLSVTTSRQHLVWALEKIAVWKDTFDSAARLLLKLAVAENSEVSNNATNTLNQLFSLIPSLSATQAPPEQRLKLIREFLGSSVPEERWIGLEACRSALDNSHTFRTVGPEHQGLRKQIQFWCPKTYGDLWKAHREVWALLTSKLDSWQSADRERLIATIIRSAWSALHTQTLTQSVVDTLERVAPDDATNIAALVDLIRRQLRNKESKLEDQYKVRLDIIARSRDGSDFPSKLRRYTRFIGWEDFHDDDHNLNNRVDLILDDLATEACANEFLLIAELPWLIRLDANTVFHLAFRVGRLDHSEVFLKHIVEQYEAANDEANQNCLCGYLAAVFNRDVSRWESLITDLAANPATAKQLSHYVVASGMSDNAAKIVIDQCRAGRQKREILERWWLAHSIRTLPESRIQELIAVNLENGTGELWDNSIQICYTYYLEKKNERQLPEEFVFALLTHELLADTRPGNQISYYWSLMAQAFIRQYPERTWELYESTLTVGTRNWSALRNLNTFGERILTTILQSHPERAFEIIARVYEKCDNSARYGLRRVISHDGLSIADEETAGPIQYVPSKALFAWVDEDIEKRGYWLAGALPKTLDESVAGRLTRDFIARYGDGKTHRSTLHVHFHDGGWHGHASLHYRKLRDQARSWLVEESNATVIRWIDEYIQMLNAEIESAEISEEREF